jgi:protease I
MTKLTGLKVAILATDGVEESELVRPRKALDDAGAVTTLVSPKKSKVKAWSAGNWATEFPVNVHLFSANADAYDALLLPGGVMNPDHLRMIPEAVEFVKKFADAKKPIAAICHGPWMLINAQAVKGRTVTSWPSIKEDLINAGANWLDKEAVDDGNLVTSRKPSDIPAFNARMLQVFAKK